MTDLAVVLISRNQDWNIARLIESVLAETKSIERRRIVLVDSASTDRTIEIARAFPIEILRLRPHRRLTPAAGRHIGFRRTAGEHALFLDGDMELCAGWLGAALRVLSERPDAAVVAGRIVDVPKTADRSSTALLAGPAGESCREVRQGGGAALYRRSVMERVGSFNPYLCSEEEPELCLRIRGAGFKVIELDRPIVFHYTDPETRIGTIVGRWRRRLYLGPGQIYRYHFGTKLLARYLRERGWGCAPGLGLAAGIMSATASLLTGRAIWVVLWLLLAAAILLAELLSKRSPYRIALSLLRRLFIVEGSVRGFFLPAPDPASYPERLDVIVPPPGVDRGDSGDEKPAHPASC